MATDLLEDIDALLAPYEGEPAEPPVERPPAAPPMEIEVKGFGVVEFPADTPRDVMLRALRARFRPQDREEAAKPQPSPAEPAQQPQPARPEEPAPPEPQSRRPMLVGPYGGFAAEFTRNREELRQQRRPARSLSEAIIRRKEGKDPVAEYERPVKYVTERLPFSPTTVIDMATVLAAADREKKGKATPDDWATLADAYVTAEQNQNRDETWAAWSKDVFDLVTQLPAFGVEFGLTGGAYTGTKKVVKEAGEAILKRGVQHQIGKAAAKSLPGTVARKIAGAVLPRAAGGAAQTAAMPHMIVENILRRDMPEYESSRDDAGILDLVIKEDDEGFAETVGKGVLDAYIEVLSERAGGVIGYLPGLKRLKGFIAAKFIAKGRTVRGLKKLLDKGGWHGPLGEIFEERVGEVARGVTGVEEDFGVTGGLMQPGTPEWDAALRQLSIEAAAFVMPTAAQGAVAVGDAVVAGKEAERLEALPEKLAAGGTVSRKDAKALENATGVKLPSDQTKRTRLVNEAIQEVADEKQRGRLPAGGTDATGRSGTGLDRQVGPPPGEEDVSAGPPVAPPEQAGQASVQDRDTVPPVVEVEPAGREGVTGGKSGVVAPPSYPKGKKFQRYHERYRKALKANDADTLAKLDEENGDWATLVVDEWFAPLSGDEIGNALDVFDAASDPRATNDVSEYAPAFKSLRIRRGPAATSKGTIIRDAIQIAGVEVEEQGQGTFTRLIRTLQERYDRPITVEQVGSSKLQALLDRHSFVEIDRANNTWAIDEHKGEDAPPDVEQPPQPPAGVSEPTGREGVKQPWEMTGFEYATQHSRRMSELRESKPRPIAKLYGKKGPTAKQAADHKQAMKAWNRAYRTASKSHKAYLEDQGSHQRLVQQAITEGRPVPPEVLADYPDLVPQAALEPIPEPLAPDTPFETLQAPETPQTTPGEQEPGAEPTTTPPEAPPADYSTLKRPELLTEIRKRGLKHYSGKKVAELRAMLERDDRLSAATKAEPAREPGPALETETAQPDAKAGETDFGAKPTEVSRIATILPETGVARAIGPFFRRFFTAAGELPPRVYDSKVRKEGRVAKEMVKLKFAATDFRRGIRKALGGKELTQVNVEEMNAVLRGGAALSTVPEEVRAPLLVMRDHIDSLARQLIAEGVAQGDLVGVITENLGVYATRSYRVFDNPNWRKQVPPEIRNRAVAAIQEMYPEKTDAEREGILESLLFKGAAESPVALLRGSKLGSKDLGIFMRRKDIPEWLRDLWGEYKDPSVNYARSVFKMSHLLANHQFLNEVRNAGLGTWLRTEEEGPIVNEYGEVIVKIAADSNSVMAPLNGLYTTPEIKAAFERVDAPGAIPEWLRILMAVNYAVKYGKTVGSAMTHIRNLVSNVGFAVANGHWRLDKAGKAIWATATGIGNLSDPEFRTYYQRLAELRLVGEDVRAGELQDALQDASKADINEFLYNTQERHARKIVNVGRAAYRATNALYQAEDGVWKIYAWENEKARYAKAYPKWTESQVEELAAQIVRDTYPTYSKVGAGVKAIRRFPLMGTFVNFPAEVIRTTFHAIRIGMEEMAAPETRAIGAQRLVGTMTALGGLSVLSAASMAALGIGGDEDDDLRWFVPPWQENSRFIYLTKKPGKYRYVDLGYSDPHAWLTDSVVAYMRGEGFLDSIAKATAELASPFTSEEILAKALRTAASNQTETGKQVYNPKDDLNQQALAVMGHLWNEALEPGTITSSRRIATGFAGTDPRREGPTEVLALTTGQRIQTVDVQHSLGFRIRDFSANLVHIQKIGRKTATSRGTVTGEQVATDRARMEKLRLAEFSEMQRILGAARRLGVSPRTIRTMLRDELKDATADELLSGDYSAYQLTPQTVQAMLAASPEEFQDRFAAWHGDDLPQATRDAATPLIANFPIAKPKRDKKYKTADEYQDAVDQWQQGRDKAKQTLSALDVSLKDALAILAVAYTKEHGSILIEGTRTLKPSYNTRKIALAKLYSQD